MRLGLGRCSLFLGRTLGRGAWEEAGEGPREDGAVVVVPARGEHGEEVVIWENEGPFLMGWVADVDNGLACAAEWEGRVEAATERVIASLRGEGVALWDCEGGGRATLSWLAEGGGPSLLRLPKAKRHGSWWESELLDTP